VVSLVAFGEDIEYMASIIDSCHQLTRRPGPGGRSLLQCGAGTPGKTLGTEQRKGPDREKRDGRPG